MTSLFHNLANAFVAKELSNIKFIILQEQYDPSLDEQIIFDQSLYDQCIKSILGQCNQEVKQQCLDSLQTSKFAECALLDGAISETMLLSHLMKIDSDNWFNAKWCLQAIQSSQVKGKMEGACIYKGCTGLNNGVNGELFTSLNRDTHTITVLLIEFND